jgi:mono/diheme cytochrome c family protein
MNRCDGVAAAGRGWLLVLAATVGAIGLAGCGKGASGGSGGAAAAAATPAGTPAASAASAAPQPSGAQLFQRCAVCHQATGQGVPGAFPPLAGSEWATAGNAAVPIRVVLHGLQGPVTVKQQRFSGAMPAYGTGQAMSDAEVAAVLTYVRSAWGNSAGAVSAEEVARERAATASRTTPWTAADLTPLLKPGH